MFVVDSNDRERMAECRYELHRVMEDKELEGCILLLLANKQDLPNALSIDEITTQLDLSSFSEKNIRWRMCDTYLTFNTFSFFYISHAPYFHPFSSSLFLLPFPSLPSLLLSLLSSSPFSPTLPSLLLFSFRACLHYLIH